MNGDHVVNRSSNPFSQVSTDMVLEQSINADSQQKAVSLVRPGAVQ